MTLVPPEKTPIKLPDNATMISNSEVDAFNTCERKHLFSFAYNREPKRKSRSLSIGIAGHDLLATYYRAIKAGLSRHDAEQEAMKDLTEMFVENTYDPEALSVVHALVTRYIAQDTITNNTKILEVESDFYLPISDTYWYAMRLDLLVEAQKGKQKGNVLLIDHKFTYDFYTFDDLKLNPQMPKYVTAVRFSGYPVQEAYINQLRTRFKGHLIGNKSDADLFQRSPVGITQARVRTAISQQMRVSERIVERKKLPIELQIEEAIPVLNRFICRNCPFKNPCEMMEDGYSAEKALGADYQIRSYGYTAKEEIDA
jgi:hypothetical protein